MPRRRTPQAAGAGCGPDLRNEILGNRFQIGGHSALRFTDKVESPQCQAFEGFDRALLGQRTKHDYGTDLLPENHLHRADAIELGHVDVHGDDIGLKLPRLLDRIFTVASRGGDQNVGRPAEQTADQVAHEGGIVGHQDADGGSRFHRTAPPMLRLELAVVESHAVDLYLVSL